VCGRGLLDPGARKLGRCEDCPSNIDQKLYDALLAWRTEQAETERMPAFVILTDATLTAIAERVPTSEGQLAQISGVGARKLGLYGEQVLAVLGGATADEVLESRSAATDSDE